MEHTTTLLAQIWNDFRFVFSFFFFFNMEWQWIFWVIITASVHLKLLPLPLLMMMMVMMIGNQPINDVVGAPIYPSIQQSLFININVHTITYTWASNWLVLVPFRFNSCTYIHYFINHLSLFTFKIVVWYILFGVCMNENSYNKDEKKKQNETKDLIIFKPNHRNDSEKKNTTRGGRGRWWWLLTFYYFHLV